jgi:hypothetical protein
LFKYTAQARLLRWLPDHSIWLMPDAGETMAGASFRSLEVLSLARSAHDRSQAVPAESEVCIALCAAALEGFFNELAFAFRTWTGSSTAVALAGLLHEAEETHASPVAKLRFAAYALSGTFPSRGDFEIQRVAVLFQLRNSLMHLKPEPIFTLLDGHPYLDKNPKPSSEIKHLMDQGLIRLPSDYTGTWRALVVQQPVARWAYNTAVGTMLWVRQQAKDPPVRSVLNTITLGLKEIDGDAP